MDKPNRTGETQWRARLQANPQDHEAWHALGLQALTQGHLSTAIECLQKAISANDTTALYHRNLGEIQRRVGQAAQAVASGRRAQQLAPDDLDTHHNLALAYDDLGDQAQAIVMARRAVQISPGHGPAWNNLGAVLEKSGAREEALKAYEQAKLVNPGHAEAQNNAGAIYSEQGRLDEARHCFEAAIAARPDFVEAHYNLSTLKNCMPDDPHVQALLRLYTRRASMPEPTRIRCCFAAGKALDDLGRHDDAFAAYAEGNALQHARMPVDEARADTLVAEIMKVFSKDFFKAREGWRGAADATCTPVFIVGMPRSGTTLLEQILSSHASVHGAGELMTLHDEVCAATQPTAECPFTGRVAVLTQEDLQAFGERYLHQLRSLSPDSRYITDKMPANFFYLGLIHLALPNARIIHAMRDPMDACFSCFSRLFSDTMAFTYSQQSLGRYWVRYQTLMRHWHDVLPPGAILDMSYEDLVRDTETHARRILEFVGLPWDERCLAFHQNERLVKTASMAQVRRPIYTTSVARWQCFARHLRPLQEIVQTHRSMNTDQASSNLTVQASAQPPAAQASHLEGLAHYRAGRFEPALACYDRAIAQSPDYAAALNSRGFLLQDLGRVQEALADFKRAVELAPEMAMARLNLGMAQLKLGQLAEGWENYEARWTGSAEAGTGNLNKPQCPLPQWNGEDGVQDKSLLVITEQGFGDTFQFARYLPLAAQRFKRVGFVCSEPTLRLMDWSYGQDIVLMTRLPADELAYKSWDFHSPLLSLPRAFGTRLESVPTQLPSLAVPQTMKDHWGQRMEAAAPGRLRVGIAWTGREAHRYNARRSLSFAQLKPLLEEPRVTWFSLQKWTPKDDPPEVPPGIDWLDWTDELDFANTAALATQLDLVISIDSAMVHLAGALQRPVWMLDRFDNEWRWLTGRQDSPWYPSLKIFRQPRFGDWEAVVATVRQSLAELPSPRELMARPLRQPTAQPAPQPPLPQAAPATTKPLLSIEQAMQLASQHQSAGRLAMAEQLLRQILQQRPRHAHALHLLGVVAFQAGQGAKALELIGQALAIDGSVALFHSNHAEMSRQQGLLQQAIDHGESAVRLDPSMAAAHSNLGIAYFDLGDHARAQACHHRALELAPKLIQSLNNMGSIFRALKDRDSAASWYRRALAIHPDYAESLSNLGAVLLEDDRAAEAIAPLERALLLQPRYPEALCNLGLARFKLEANDDAIGLLKRALAVKPNYAEALIGLTRALTQADRVGEAEHCIRSALAQRPESSEAWCLLGTLQMEQARSDEAEASLERALSIEPELPDALTALGNLRLEQGRMEDSVQLLEQALALDPRHLAARFHLAQARKTRRDDTNLAALEQMLPEADAMSTEKRISLHYALGKAYDDLKAWDKAFPHFMKGAALKRSKLNYDAERDEARTAAIARIVDKAFVDRFASSGDPSKVPIFVLGMPRSGTTLTEQIIASHPQVHGAGELRDLMESIHTPQDGQEPFRFPDDLQRIDRDTFARWGAEYVARLRRRAPDAQHITDKMPANYMSLGIIPLMLPGAKIVHVRRNPVDTCISCFTRLFNRHQDATYDLYELGRHYASYARLMDHWRAVLPAGSFLEVQYEDVVADIDTQARRLIEFVGLPWDDKCLAFHENKRSIRTASVAQVRQPIYNSSVDRWRHYESHLAPLMQGLGEFAPT